MLSVCLFSIYLFMHYTNNKNEYDNTNKCENGNNNMINDIQYHNNNNIKKKIRFYEEVITATRKCVKNDKFCHFKLNVAII